MSAPSPTPPVLDEARRASEKATSISDTSPEAATPERVYPGIIVGGIEWIYGGRECECARCGSSCDMLDCWNCHGEGVTYHDCGEDTCCCLDKVENVVCAECGGMGVTWHCLSRPEWCEANPLPGREHIESTALEARAWTE